jgi:hypothetical protein
VQKNLDESLRIMAPFDVRIPKLSESKPYCWNLEK